MGAPKTDWAKRVSESEGTSVFLPDAFKKIQQDLDATRIAYNAEINKMAEREIAMNMATQNMFLDVRKYLAKNGYPDIWVKEIGFDVHALKDGVFVINIVDKNGQ